MTDSTYTQSIMVCVEEQKKRLQLLFLKQERLELKRLRVWRDEDHARISADIMTVMREAMVLLDTIIAERRRNIESLIVAIESFE